MVVILVDVHVIVAVAAAGAATIVFDAAIATISLSFAYKTMLPMCY